MYQLLPNNVLINNENKPPVKTYFLFTASVVDTGGAPSVSNIFAKFRQKKVNALPG